MAAVTLAGLCTIAGAFAWYGRALPDVHGLRTSWRPPQTSRILAVDGSTLAELFTERRTVVPLGNLPENLVKALLAAEDADFYVHQGLDYLGMLRALLVNLRRGTIAQGASTITQQVVKNVLLTPERTFGRKVREVLLARRIEHELTKNEILYLYVNHIAFGDGRNGVEEAARYYFGKHVGQLTLGECALLAGIPRSPVHYSPRNNLDAALHRRHWILGRMVTNGFVTVADANAADREPVRLAPLPEESEGYAPEVVEVVRRMLVSMVGDEAFRHGGYTISTTIDPALQRAAREAVTHGLDTLDSRHGYVGPLIAPLPNGRRPAASTGYIVHAEAPPRDNRLRVGHIYLGVIEDAHDPVASPHTDGEIFVRVGAVVGRVPWHTVVRYARNGLSPTVFAPRGAPVRVSVLQPGSPEAPPEMRFELGPQAALVALDPQSRSVRAIVGGYDALPGMFDRATQAMRQPGSAFKPLLYSYALSSRRYTLASTVDPNPGCFGGWCPHEAHAHPGLVEAPMRLREALAQSRNMVAARLMDVLGTDAVIAHARNLGLRAPMPTDLSLALGSGTVTPVQLINTYATFASGGRYQDWQVVTRIVGPDGRDLPLPPRVPARQAIPAADAYVVTSAMTSVIDHGTGRGAQALHRPAAGKTGTTDGSRDAWFVGYTPDLVAGVWVGFDDRQSLGAGEEGARAALPVWTAFMLAYVHDKHPPALDFAVPPGVVTAMIDPATGLLAAPGATDALREVFLTGTEPHETAPSPDAQSDVPPVDASDDRVESDTAPLVLPVETVPVPLPGTDAGPRTD